MLGIIRGKRDNRRARYKGRLETRLCASWNMHTHRARVPSIFVWQPADVQRGETGDPINVFDPPTLTVANTLTDLSFMINCPPPRFVCGGFLGQTIQLKSFSSSCYVLQLFGPSKLRQEVVIRWPTYQTDSFGILTFQQRLLPALTRPIMKINKYAECLVW